MSNLIKESVRGLEKLDAEDILMTARKIFLTEQVDRMSCDDLLKKLMALNEDDPNEPITLYINSPGGDVYSGLAVYDYIRIMPAPLITVCVGMAASMGALLFLAGEKRLVMPHSRIMIHDPSFSSGQFGGMKPHELQRIADDLKSVRDVTARVIADVTGKRINQILKVTKDDTYYSAEEAIDFGLATGMWE